MIILTAGLDLSRNPPNTHIPRNTTYNNTSRCIFRLFHRRDPTISPSRDNSSDDSSSSSSSLENQQQMTNTSSTRTLTSLSSFSSDISFCSSSSSISSFPQASRHLPDSDTLSVSTSSTNLADINSLD